MPSIDLDNPADGEPRTLVNDIELLTLKGGLPEKHLLALERLFDRIKAISDKG